MSGVIRTVAQPRYRGLEITTYFVQCRTSTTIVGGKESTRLEVPRTSLFSCFVEVANHVNSISSVDEDMYYFVLTINIHLLHWLSNTVQNIGANLQRRNNPSGAQSMKQIGRSRLLCNSNIYSHKAFEKPSR